MALWCLDQYFAELATRFPFVPPTEPEPASVFLVLREEDQPVACGALRLQDERTAYLKRMWVHPEHRGKGLGRQILSALEKEAQLRGLTRLWLETHGSLTEAIRLYGKAGYREVPPFNADPNAQHWFEKDTSGSHPGS